MSHNLSERLEGIYKHIRRATFAPETRKQNIQKESEGLLLESCCSLADEKNTEALLLSDQWQGCKSNIA
jgi:hypothetical protein